MTVMLVLEEMVVYSCLFVGQGQPEKGPLIQTT